jgi:glycine cleavage system H protein
VTGIPRGLRYSADHLWFRREGERVTVGVTEQASRILTWVNAVDLPAPGRGVAAGDELGSIDSQKTDIAISAPVPLQVTAVNQELASDPMLVRMNPYDRGWLFQAVIDNDAWEQLLDEAAYQALIDEAE